MEEINNHLRCINYLPSRRTTRAKSAATWTFMLSWHCWKNSREQFLVMFISIVSLNKQMNFMKSRKVKRHDFCQTPLYNSGITRFASWTNFPYICCNCSRDCTPAKMATKTFTLKGSIDPVRSNPCLHDLSVDFSHLFNPPRRVDPVLQTGYPEGRVDPGHIICLFVSLWNMGNNGQNDPIFHKKPNRHTQDK